jgi:hypothetical protein
MRNYDIIRSKDLGFELDDLKDEIDALVETLDNDDLTDDESFNIEIEIKDLVNDARYKALLEIQDELIEMVRNGSDLILVDDFTAYLKENYNDMFGDIPDNLVMYIDWESLANDVAQDYTVIEFDGDSYYIL